MGQSVIKRLGYNLLCFICIRHCERIMFRKNIWQTCFFYSIICFCICNRSIGVTSVKLHRQYFIGQRILFQMWTSAAATHVKMEALALMTSTSTAVSALLGTLVRTVKQVRVAVLVFLVGGASSRVAELVITHG